MRLLTEEEEDIIRVYTEGIITVQEFCYLGRIVHCGGETERNV